MTDPRTNAEQVALLRECIRRSGLSNRKFAELVMTRDERTVRRWLAGTQTIPAVALRRLAALLAEKG